MWGTWDYSNQLGLINNFLHLSYIEFFTPTETVDYIYDIIILILKAFFT